MVTAIMMYAKPLATETAIAVPAANPQTSVFAYASIGSLPLAASLQSKPPLARIVPLSACGEQMGPCYMPAAHIAPATAMKVTPATNIAAANRQLLCRNTSIVGSDWRRIAAFANAPIKCCGIDRTCASEEATRFF